ncbi:trypsin-like peptidase domain-containing protein [Thermostilla marina]
MTASAMALMAFAFAAVPGPLTAVDENRCALVERVTPAVVAVFSPRGDSGGSGVLISPDGFAVTNYHVVEPCGPFMKCGLADGNLYDAVIVGVDPTGDIALIKLLGRDDFPAAQIGDSRNVRPGDPCLAMGNPFMLAADFQPTATFGIISGIHRYQYPAGTLLEYTDCLQTDASINPGNSGGPLFDAAGRLIGINGRASFEKRGRINVGVAYAVSINQVVHFLGMLKAGRIVDHASLGAVVSSTATGGAAVSDILETSDAWRRGLRYDDELLFFADRAIATPNEFKNVLGTLPAGWSVLLEYRTDRGTNRTWVRLERLHPPGELIDRVEKGLLGLARTDSEGDSSTQRDVLPVAASDTRSSKLPVIEVPKPRLEDRLPDAVRPYFEYRRGYANYYFNRHHKEGLLATRKLPFNSAEAWTLSGRLEGSGTFLATVENTGARIVFPQRTVTWTSPPGDEPLIAGDETGRLLALLWCWQKYPQLSPLSETLEYWGQAPLVLETDLRLYEVLRERRKAGVIDYYVDPQTALLAAVAWTPTPEDDTFWLLPADRDGNNVPRTIVYVAGDLPVAKLQVETLSAP